MYVAKMRQYLTDLSDKRYSVAECQLLLSYLDCFEQDYLITGQPLPHPLLNEYVILDACYQITSKNYLNGVQDYMLLSTCPQGLALVQVHTHELFTADDITCLALLPAQPSKTAEIIVYFDALANVDKNRFILDLEDIQYYEDIFDRSIDAITPKLNALLQQYTHKDVSLTIIGGSRGGIYAQCFLEYFLRAQAFQFSNAKEITKIFMTTSPRLSRSISDIVAVQDILNLETDEYRVHIQPVEKIRLWTKHSPGISLERCNYADTWALVLSKTFDLSLSIRTQREFADVIHRVGEEHILRTHHALEIDAHLLVLKSGKVGFAAHQVNHFLSYGRVHQPPVMVAFSMNNSSQYTQYQTEMIRGNIHQSTSLNALMSTVDPS